MAILPTFDTPRPRIGIIGLGLMGGSLARALKATAHPPFIAGAATESDHRKRALDSGAVDEAHIDPVEVAATSDLLVYATPLGATLSLFENHLDVWGSHTIITDVGSLQAPLVELVQEERFTERGVHARYIASHPMCGGAESGFRASRTDLYQSARIWLTRGSGSDLAAEQVKDLWDAVGGESRWIDAAEHDQTMAWCSHLPQLVANALAGALDMEGFQPDDLGPGGRDMVRLAESSPPMWRDLLASSGPAVEPSLRAVARGLHAVADLLAAGDPDAVAAFMDRTRLWMRQGKLRAMAPPPGAVGVQMPTTREE